MISKIGTQLPQGSGSWNSINWNKMIRDLSVAAVFITIGWFFLLWQKNEHEHDEKMASTQSVENEKDRVEKKKARKSNQVIDIAKTIMKGADGLIGIV